MIPITYKPNPSCEGGMEVHRYGRYVSLKEYENLKAEVERLRKAGDAMANELPMIADTHLSDEVWVRMQTDWQLAKEGKQS